jgi:hypothetical protein
METLGPWSYPPTPLAQTCPRHKHGHGTNMATAQTCPRYRNAYRSSISKSSDMADCAVKMNNMATILQKLVSVARADEIQAKML